MENIIFCLVDAVLGHWEKRKLAIKMLQKVIFGNALKVTHLITKNSTSLFTVDVSFLDQIKGGKGTTFHCFIDSKSF